MYKCIYDKPHLDAWKHDLTKRDKLLKEEKGRLKSMSIYSVYFKCSRTEDSRRVLKFWKTSNCFFLLFSFREILKYGNFH